MSAKICNKINEDTHKTASLLEILHVATLIHDDVVDESDLRRGWPSVNRVWKNKLSILIGDFLFSKALTNMANINSIESVKILANLASRLSQGEILQIEKALNKKDLWAVSLAAGRFAAMNLQKIVGEKKAMEFFKNCVDTQKCSELKD